MAVLKNPFLTDFLNIKEEPDKENTCCICGNSFSGYGNNPAPLCSNKDTSSRCCDRCDAYVTRARFLQFEDLRYKENSVSHNIREGSIVAILWASGSKKPFKSLFTTGKFLAGEVTEVKDNKIYGTWGSFPLKRSSDNYIILG